MCPCTSLIAVWPFILKSNYPSSCQTRPWLHLREEVVPTHRWEVSRIPSENSAMSVTNLPPIVPVAEMGVTSIGRDATDVVDRLETCKLKWTWHSNCNQLLCKCKPLFYLFYGWFSPSWTLPWQPLTVTGVTSDCSELSRSCTASERTEDQALWLMDWPYSFFTAYTKLWWWGSRSLN